MTLTDPRETRIDEVNDFLAIVPMGIGLSRKLLLLGF